MILPGIGGLALPNSGFVGYSTIYDSGSTSTSTISIPAGASGVVIENIGKGGAGYSNSGVEAQGGGGGAYSLKTLASLAGYTGIYLDLSGADAVAKQNSSGGTTVCLAKAGANGVAGTPGQGGQAASGVGDTKYSGGDGYGEASPFPKGYGGGAAGPSGNGGSAWVGGAGTSGGSPGGAGGGIGANGNDYGGGAGSSNSGGMTGGKSYIKLTWS